MLRLNAKVLGQAEGDLNGRTPVLRFDLPQRDGGAADQPCQLILGETQGFAAMLQPFPECKLNAHVRLRSPSYWVVSVFVSMSDTLDPRACASIECDRVPVQKAPITARLGRGEGTHQGICTGRHDQGRRMFITVYTYRAKPGMEEVTIALHTELSQYPVWHGPGFLSAELLQSLEDPLEFVEVTRLKMNALPGRRPASRNSLPGIRVSWRLLELGPSFSHFHSIVESRARPCVPGIAGLTATRVEGGVMRPWSPGGAGKSQSWSF